MRKFQELSKMIFKCIIVPVSYKQEKGEFISSIFIRPKKDRGVRIILNLKKIEQNCYNTHFKLQTSQQANALMASKSFFA